MNKYLKKVISAVAALAISASAVSAFAVNFPDVPEDASYAQAVQELSALKVISGFDDGTFRPDELVTRAQITKMIVDALAETNQAESSKAKSQFTDVNDHWAQGYINQGVADGFIAGYGDGTFGPDNNVTYVEAQKMLVSAIGYETYAIGAGGWPNGYKTYAASTGVTDGVAGINDDTQLTRAQVAKLVNNTMGAPLCVVDGYTTTWDGKKVPDLKVRNKEGKDYQTLFTNKHDAYKVYGRVTKTSKTDGLDLDKVEFQVEKAENFDDQWIGTAKNADEETIVEEMYFGDTNAPDYLLSYSQALIQKDSNDEFHIISIAPAAAAKAETLAAEDFDKEKTDREKANVTNGKYSLYFYPAGTTRNSQKKVVDVDDANYKVYVNGVEDTSLTDIDALIDFIDQNRTAAITLEKQTKQGSTNSSTEYNLVNIVNYQTAIVSEVNVKSNVITIGFEDQEMRANNLKVELDNDDIAYSFTLDGAEIDPADLQEGDVLSIAYKANDWNNSTFYDVIVSRDTAENVQCTSSDTTEGEYTFDNGSTYKTLFGIVPDMTSTYVLYLDHFGRIAKVDENVANKKIAVLKNVYKKAGGDYYVQIITKEGAEEEYKVDTTNVSAFQTVLVSKDANGEADYTATTKVVAYPQQVIEYSVSSATGKITLKGTLTGDTTAGKQEYRATSGKLDGIKLNSSTVILDMTDANDDEFDVISVEDLTDGNYYAAVGYDQTTSGDKYHRFVILTDGIASYNSASQMAVIMNVQSVSDDGTTKTQYRLAYNGDEKTYIVDDEKAGTAAANYKAGDVILFKANGSDHITDVELINQASGWVSGTWTSFKDAVLGATDANDFIRLKKDENTTWADFLKDGNSDEVAFVFGVVANKQGSSVTIAMPSEFTAGDETVAAGIDADSKTASYNVSGAKAYSYNFAQSTSKGASKVSYEEGNLCTSKRKSAEKVGSGDGYVNHTIIDLTATVDGESVFDTNDYVFAVARIDNRDEVQEILYIYNED